MSTENKKDWERPWTTEEIVEHADDWNLACDSALLNTLKAFGDKILKKAEDVNDKIEDLHKNLSKVDIQVDLARNEFSSLRNTQFLECRVYEDDETLVSEKQEDQEKTNVPEEETLEDLREAVALGLEILDEYYDKVAVTVSDSEGEEEDVPSYIYRRKDPYINRKLPLVIGSEEWHKKWHVGLEDSDSENEKSSETLSDSENEDNISQNKDFSDVSSELSNVSGLKTSKLQPGPVSTTNLTQDLSATASSSDISADLTPKNLTFAEQLAAKLGNVIKEKEAPLNEPEVNRRPIQKKPSDYGALFSSEPPPFEDIKTQEPQGIFSGGKGLFDDEDDDDLWNPGSSKMPSNSRLSTTTDLRTADKVKGLFDDDSDDEIFSSSRNYSITKQNNQPYIQSNKPLVPIFDEEPPLFEEETNTKEKKKPTGGVSLFGKTDIFQGQNVGKILKERKPSTSEDEPEIFPKKEIESSVSSTVSFADKEIKSNSSQQTSSKQTISTVPQSKEPEKKKSMLFDDDIFSDDLFSSVEKKSPSGLFEKSILFSDEDTIGPFSQSETNDAGISSKNKNRTDESGTLPNTIAQSSEIIKTKNTNSSIFNDSKDDKIFMPKRASNDVKKQGKDKKDSKNVEKVEKPNIITQNTLKTSLFDDDLDDVDDLFSGISKKNNTENKKSMSFLFDGNEDDDFDIFSPKDNKTNSRNVEVEKESTKIEKIKETEQPKEDVKTTRISKPKISLFDDDLDDMDDLFSQISKKSNATQSSRTETSDSEKISEFSIKSSQSNTTKSEEKLEKNKKRNDVETITEGLGHSENSVIKINTMNEPVLESKAIEKPLDVVVTSNQESSREELNTSLKKEDDSNNSQDHLNKSIKNQEFQKEDEHDIPEISVVDELKTNAEIIEDSSPVSKNPLNMEDTAYKSSPNVLNVKFMDSIPPPVDDWDNYSDNTCDDVEPGNDGFHSQTSSLFDNEPPSLFFDDTSAVLEKPINNRITSISQEVPSDIFSSSILTNDDGESKTNPTNKTKTTESSDSSVGSKSINEEIHDISCNIENSLHSPEKFEENEKISNPTNDEISSNEKKETDVSVDSRDSGKLNEPAVLDQENIQSETEENYKANDQNKMKAKPPITRLKPGSNKKSPLFDAPPTTEKSDSLFSDITDGDETDFLFSSNLNQTNKDSNNLKINKNIISDNKGNEKSVSFDDNSEDPTGLYEPGVGAESDDNMQSNILKITEKLQQQSNKHAERTKPLAVPQKLSHNLNINVGALLPGSALPRKSKTPTSEENEKLSKSLPASRIGLNAEFLEKTNAQTKPISIVRVSSEDLPNKPEYKFEKSVSFDGSTDTEVLQSITKDRARIPVKRRPSSRRARQKSLRDSISEFRLDDPIPDEALTCDNKKIDSVNTLIIEQNTPDTQLLEKTNREKEILPNKRSEDVLEKTGNLSNSENDSYDLFKSIGSKNVNEANTIGTDKKELFEEDHEELFKNTNTKVTKKIPDLFEDEDLFGSKTQLSKKVDDTQKRTSSHDKIPDTNKKSIFSDDDFKIKDKGGQNDFLKSIENLSDPGKKPNVEKKSKIDNLFDSSDDEDIFKSTKTVVKETKSAKDIENKNAPSISIIGKLAGKADSTPSNSQNKKPKPLFDFSDDEDFLQSLNDQKKADKKPAVKHHSNLFDDMDDDDIFSISSAENKNRQDAKPSVINKKPPKSSSLRKLENIEGNEDPLSALLK